LVRYAASAQIVFPIDSAVANPLAHPKEISANREIALVYDEKDGNNNIKMRRKLFDVNQLNINDMNSAIALQPNFPVYTGAPDSYNNRHIGSCTGDFDGDMIDEYVTGTEGPNRQIYLRSFGANAVGAQLEVSPAGSSQNAGLLTQANGDAGFIKLMAGNFDNTPGDEVALAFR
jgi:hypothetical protein